MKKIIKQGITLLVGVLSVGYAASPAYAADTETQKALVVHLKSGETEQFLLEEKPQLTFTASECKFTSPTYEVTHDMADISEARFAMVTSGIESTETDCIKVDLSSPGTLVVSGIKSASPVNVYSLEGINVASATASASESVTMDISRLQKNAVYIVSIANLKQFKIYIR
ncbi:MAG: hypothetical protein NC548_46505 [Lachnospiraceae bacterium]|nr:hypothetical protein [Prevotella sp.]MCM1074635.1 hypothetical protein [Ruminococcus sp.]MCM1221949.1 hypothetical protein [Lachnospiraceae bacterium]